MTTPALLRLREAHPAARITLLTHAKLADLWRNHRAVDEVISFQARESIWSIARRLRQQSFSTAIVLPNSPRSALEVFLARVPTRIGLAHPWRNIFLTQRIPPRRNIVTMRKRSPAEVRRLVASDPRVSEPTFSPSASSSHQMHHYLHLVAALGASADPVPPRIEIGDDEVRAVQKRFGPTVPIDHSRPLFGLNPGAEYGPAKRWPRERFVAAAIALQRETKCRWWIFGGPADRELATSIAQEVAAAQPNDQGSVRSVAGETSLRELCAALKACHLVLTNDTGPMHLAAAVGTSVIVPFGSTSPELTGPGMPGDDAHKLLRAQVPCSPCFLRECPIDFRCMKSISADVVVKAMLNSLHRTKA